MLEHQCRLDKISARMQPPLSQQLPHFNVACGIPRPHDGPVYFGDVNGTIRLIGVVNSLHVRV